jgi:hypothetical protein
MQLPRYVLKIMKMLMDFSNLNKYNLRYNLN